MLFTSLDDLAAEISLTPLQAIGIPLALVGAVFLSVGTQFQHRGVGHFQGGDQRGASLGGKAVLRMLREPAWVVGTVLLGLAIAFQLAALAFAPLIVVQPLGAVALVVTALLNARRTLLAGFTTVRDLGAEPRTILSLRDAINAGQFAGPTIFAAGAGVAVTGGHGDVNGLNRDLEGVLKPRATHVGIHDQHLGSCLSKADRCICSRCGLPF